MGDVSRNYHRTLVPTGYPVSLPGSNAAEVPGKRSKLRAQTRPCSLKTAGEEGKLVACGTLQKRR